MKKKTINSIIGVLLMVIGWIIPAVEGSVISPLGFQILFIFIGAVYLWCTVDLIWPSFLAVILLGLTSYGTVSTVLGAAMSNSTVMLMFYMMLVAGVANEAGLVNWLARKILNIKALKGRPWLLTIAIFTAAFLGSAVVEGVAAVLICWNIVYKIIDEAGFETHDKWPSLAIFGVIYASCLGTSLLPFKFTVVGTYGFAKMAAPDLTYDYLKYTLVALLISLVALAVYILIARLVIRPDVSRLKASVDVEKAEKLTKKQKRASLIILVMVIMMMLPSFISKVPALNTFFGTKLGTVGCALVAIVLALVVRSDGEPLVTFTGISKGILWGVIIMSASAITVSGALVSPDTGVSALLMSVLSPILSGTSSGLFVLVVVAATLIATNFINNAIIFTVAVPLVATLVVSMGTINLAGLTALLVFSCSMGLFFPSSSPYGAMVHGNKERIATKDVFKYGAIAMLCTLIGIMAAYPVASAIM